MTNDTKNMLEIRPVSLADKAIVIGSAHKNPKGISHAFPTAVAGCRRRRLNQGLVVALDFLSVLVLDRACFCVIFWFLGVCFV